MNLVYWHCLRCINHANMHLENKWLMHILEMIQNGGLHKLWQEFIMHGHEEAVVDAEKHLFSSVAGLRLSVCIMLF